MATPVEGDIAFGLAQMQGSDRIEKMAENIYLFPDFGNVGVVVTGEGVVIVDTGSPSKPHTVLDRLRQITDEPVKYIIYTHGQADHAANAQALLDDAAQRGYPRPTIIGHSRVAARMNRYAEMYGHNAFINRIQFRVPKDKIGFPPNFRFIRPDVTYEESMKFRLGKYTFELYHEMGETDDITWVHIPEQKAIFTGDLIIYGCPNIGNPFKIQRFTIEWAQAMEHMASKGAEVLGPGHGEVLRGEPATDWLLTTGRALHWLHDEVVRRMNEGQWEEQIINEVELPAEFANHPAMAPVYGCPYYIVRATYRRYGGWYSGNPSHLKSSRTADIAKEVVVLAGPESLIKRAEVLSGNGNPQLALHLLDYVIDSGADKALKAQALQMKSVALKALAEAETSFISRSILFNGSLTAAEEANALED
jgi:glyoxylase-like metal-dependent hydrolase (beta-lactamase superfamily II)